MELLHSEKLKNKTKLYMQRAIGYKNCEFEFIYGSNQNKGKLQRESFLKILNALSQKFTISSEEITLDIQPETNRSGLSDVRCTIHGLENIKKYCKTNSLSEIVNVSYALKKKYKDEDLPSVNFDSIIEYDYNFRINLKHEEELDENNHLVQKTLMGWNTKNKYFRYKKRKSFITPDQLFRIDLTAIKSNDYDKRNRKYRLFKQFTESNILEKKEEYEIEIEYIGSLSQNGIFPIDIFTEKKYIEDKEKLKKFEQMNDKKEDKINLSKYENSSFTPEDVNDYSIDTNWLKEEPQYTTDDGIPIDELEGAIGGEFGPENIIVMPEQKKVRPEWSFEDIKYEYWEDSNREWLFEAILMYGKTLYFLSEKNNIDGDYKNAPKNTTYIEYEITPKFDEKEIEEIEDYDATMNHIVLVPKEYIVSIQSYKKLSWAPGAKRVVDKKDTESEAEKLYQKYFGKDGMFPHREDIYGPDTHGEKHQRGKRNEIKDIGLMIIESVIEVLKQYIELILKLKENRELILKESLKEKILLDYRNLTEQTDNLDIQKNEKELKELIKKQKDKKEIDKKNNYINFKRLVTTKFLGPNPVSMSLDNINHTKAHSILEKYVVTEKADGVRAQLYINNLDGYLITQKKEIIPTGLRFEKIEEDGLLSSWLFDGEYITQNKHGDPIELFMVFDVYYAADGASKYPAHAHTYPWISKKKKDISRSLIISDFKNEVEIINEKNSQFRVHFKNYLEGPKSLKKSKKDKQKYSNITEICKQSKKILDFDQKEYGGYEYNIDGLIYMPMFLPVKSLDEGVIPHNIGGEWSINYKWKPPEENTIDFRVRIVQEKTKNGLRDKITSSRINGKTVVCKQVKLYVGYERKQDITFDYNWKILNNEYTKELKEILFNPEPEDQSYYFCNIPLKDNKIFCEKDKSEILDGQLIEMRYNNGNSKDILWTPLRVRSDKSAPQFFLTANKIWKTIQHPVTYELIAGIDDISNLELLKHDKEEDLQASDKYYIDSEKDSISDTPLRKLHNYIKQRLISSTCSIGKSSISILDTSIGRGGDIGKYLDSKNPIKFLLGLDISSNIHEAAQRFYLENNIKKIKAMFIQYDTSESIRDGWGYKGEQSTIERNEKLVNIIYDKPFKKKLPEEYKKIQKTYSNICGNGFDIISSQFSLHYYFKDEMTLNGYLQNLSDNCKNGGYFIGTCYDGKKIYDYLSSQERGIFEMIDEFDNKVFSLSLNKQNYDNFEFDKSNIKSMFGREISVYMNSIGQEIPEYLVNFDMFKEKMKQYRFKLVNPKLKGINSGIFNKESYCIEDGLGSFSEIINHLDTLSNKDSLLKNRLSNVKAPFGQALEINKKENEKLKLLSSMNNWFIFQKY